MLAWLFAAPSASAADFTDLRSGDCVVRLEGLQDNVPTAQLRLLKDETETDIAPRVVRRRNGTVVVEFPLRDPLMINSQLKVTLDSATGEADVATGRVDQVGSSRRSCRPLDERGDFEPQFFYGARSDSFAPNSAGNYPIGTDYSLKVSQVLTLEAQIRPLGRRGSWLDGLWLTSEASYGVRSTDLNCQSEVDKKSPACDPTNSAFVPSKNAGAAFTANVLRATRIQALFMPRLEGPTLNVDGDAPLTLFVMCRFGLSQVPEDLKPSNAYGCGGGFLFRSGPFRDSEFTVIWGEDHGFRTNPNALRTRMDFRFFFDPLAAIWQQIPGIPQKKQSLRGLIEVIVDRNFLGSGPDMVQTHLGLALDFRQLLEGS